MSGRLSRCGLAIFSDRVRCDSFFVKFSFSLDYLASVCRVACRDLGRLTTACNAMHSFTFSASLHSVGSRG